MQNKKTAVFGIYPSVDQATCAVDTLVPSTFTNDDISVLMPDQQSSKDFAHEKHTKAPEGATTGAATGGVPGGTLGLLAGIGALAIPGLGPFIAAGPIMGALAGLGAGGAVGGLVGALVGLGVPEYEAKRYEGRVKEGGILLSVHCATSSRSATRRRSSSRLAPKTSRRRVNSRAPATPLRVATGLASRYNGGVGDFPGTAGRSYASLYASAFPYSASSRLHAFSACGSL